MDIEAAYGYVMACPGTTEVGADTGGLLTTYYIKNHKTRKTVKNPQKHLAIPPKI